jgi:AcrR family transcriptional regulator
LRERAEEHALAAKTLSRRDLYNLVWSTPMKTAAETMGLSPNGLAKICDRLLVPYPTRGYWNKTGAQRPRRTPLPKAPEQGNAPVTIAKDRAASRRPRTRLTPEARRTQLLDAAMKIVGAEGIGAVSMKRVARDIGVSEALAFTYFSTRAELLADVARRELAAMSAYQQAEIARGQSVRSRVALSTIAYLRQIEERGSTLHLLLSAPEVRTLLRPERQTRKARGSVNVSTRFADRYGVPADFAYGATQALTSASRRAGRLLAMGKIERQAVEGIILAIVEQGNRDLAAEAAKRPAPSSPRPARRAKS